MPITVQDIMNHKLNIKSKREPKKWHGKQTCCDLCEISFNDIPWFVDARTYTGQWAIMCPDCLEIYGMNRTLGTGKGQKYDASTRLKLEG